MPTVEHVLRLVLPAGSELLAGEAGLLSEVAWVVTLKPTAPGFREPERRGVRAGGRGGGGETGRLNP